MLRQRFDTDGPVSERILTDNEGRFVHQSCRAMSQSSVDTIGRWLLG
jgi:hypothetical protein